ncbi:hypothetical protein EDC04DRAFT_2966065 [Pisolithus marmoratus]|nr:hypothetical protein EDC04DRAFT_2966065 [Pisolithus marmoratus]
MTANLAQVLEGPFLIGLAMNIFLYGLVTMQVYLYFTTFTKLRDGFRLKSLLVSFISFMLCLTEPSIVTLHLMETFNCVISIYYAYDTLVVHFDDEANILRGSWIFAAGTNLFPIFPHPQLNKGFCNWRYCLDGALSFPVRPSLTYNLLQGLVSAGVQHFFVWRVYMLTKNVFIVAAVVLYSLASLAGSLATTVNLAIDPSTFQVSGLRVEVAIWLAGAVLADATIAASLIWHLGRHKTSYPALNSVVNQIIRMTVQTGVLTTVAAIIEMVCYLTGNISVYVVFSLILSKLYTNCMLSTLNARRKFEVSSLDEVSHGKSTRPEVVVFQSQGSQPEVFMRVESYQMIDMDDKPPQV